MFYFSKIAKNMGLGILLLSNLKAENNLNISEEEIKKPINVDDKSENSNSSNGQSYNKLSFSLESCRPHADTLRENNNFLSLLEERILYKTTNQFQNYLFFDVFLEQEQNREPFSDILDNPLRSSIKSGGKEALLQSFWDNSPINYYIRGEIGARLKDMLGPQEKNQLVNPFRQDEGIPGFEKENYSIIPKKRKWGIRPFRTDPYGYFSANFGESMILNARISFEHLELINQIPLTKSWTFINGIQKNFKDYENAYGFFGIGGYFLGGRLSLGTTLMIDSGKNSSDSGFRINFVKDY